MRGNSQGLTKDKLSKEGLTTMSAMRSRLRNREISMRQQVGDAESMVNEEGTTRKDDEDSV